MYYTEKVGLDNAVKYLLADEKIQNFQEIFIAAFAFTWHKRVI